MEVMSFTLRPLYPQGKSFRYPLNNSLGGPQSRSGRCVEEINLLPSPSIEPRSHGRLVHRLTELPRLLLFIGPTTLCRSLLLPWSRNSRFFRDCVVSPRPNPNLEDQRLHLVWPLPFDLSCTGGSTRSLHSRQHSSPR
jgi:hypothetical protein